MMKKGGKIALYIIIPGIFLVLSAVKLSISSTNNSPNANLKTFKNVIDKLLTKGADTAFVKIIVNDPRTEFNERFARVTLSGYAKKPDYSPNYSQYSIDRSKTFIKENINILRDCENKYGVSKEVITSILWVETKFGEYLGNNHIISVFLSAALADKPEIIEADKKNLRLFFCGDSTLLTSLDDKIIEKAKKKSEWAISELLNLQKMYYKTPDKVLGLRGSWAGAFGMSQFLPSSYNNYAVNTENDSIPDLFLLPDAIMSIGNYLKNNGWGDSPQSQRKAIFNYNNSSDYVDAVIILAAKMREYSWRLPLRQKYD